MQTLPPTLCIYDDRNYDAAWPRFVRQAVRAVVVRDSRLALVKSATEGFYKFPGGGVEHGESHQAALIREAREETGLELIPASIHSMGLVREIRKGTKGCEVFDQQSFYYYARAGAGLSQLRLDDYEARLGFHLVWMDIETAYRTNRTLYKQTGHTFLRREAGVLKRLLDASGTA